VTVDTAALWTSVTACPQGLDNPCGVAHSPHSLGYGFFCRGENSNINKGAKGPCTVRFSSIDAGHHTWGILVVAEVQL